MISCSSVFRMFFAHLCCPVVLWFCGHGLLPLSDLMPWCVSGKLSMSLCLSSFVFVFNTSLGVSMFEPASWICSSWFPTLCPWDISCSMPVFRHYLYAFHVSVVVHASLVYDLFLHCMPIHMYLQCVCVLLASFLAVQLPHGVVEIPMHLPAEACIWYLLILL